MWRTKELELENNKASPFTLLLAIYRAKLALRVTGWEGLALAKQCEYLLPPKINSRSGRRKTIANLIENEANFDELKQKSYLRIHIKYILLQYSKQILKLSQSKNTNSWNSQDLIISFVSHLISNVEINENKKVVAAPKVWEFANYLRKYFTETQYDGNAFLDSFALSKSGNNADKPTKGYGLQMMKTVCSKYGLKSGPYSKVKKQCNLWALKTYQQSKGVAKPAKAAKPAKVVIVGHVANNNEIGADGAPEKPKYSGNWSKFVTQIPLNYHTPPDKFAGKAWFWFNDNGGYKWVPYRENDIKKLNKAWNNNEKTCMIINGEYRVEFDYRNAEKPAGNQYNNRQQNAGGRTVICSDKNSSEIHGIKCAQNPL